MIQKGTEVEILIDTLHRLGVKNENTHIYLKENTYIASRKK